MSDKVLMPKPDVLVESCGGASLLRYRMAFTSIRIDPTQDSGRRIEVCEDGHRIIFDLSAEQAKHFAGLLSPASPEPARVAS